MVPTGDIASALDNPALTATADQSHIYQLTATILKMTETNSILGVQTKHLYKTNVILTRQVQDKEKPSKKRDLSRKIGPRQVLCDSWVEGHQGEYQYIT